MTVAVRGSTDLAVSDGGVSWKCSWRDQELVGGISGWEGIYHSMSNVCLDAISSRDPEHAPLLSTDLPQLYN